MKASILSTLCLGLAVSACNKDDSSGESSKPQTNVPGISLVAGEFKNTAKNGADVSTKLNAAASTLKSTSLSGKTYRDDSQTNDTTPVTTDDILNSLNVANFLDQSRPNSGTTSKPNNSSGSFDLSTDQGHNCGNQLSFLNATYTQGAEAIRTSARIITDLDTAELPAGVTREGANDQFAVTYSFDFSQFKVQPKDNGQSAGNESNVQVTGSAKIAAGANEDTAVIAAGINSTSSGQNNFNLALNGGFAMAAHAKDKVLKLSSDGSAKGTYPKDGQVVNLDVTENGVLTLQAGKDPYIELLANISANGNFKDNKVTTTPEKHDYQLNVKISKASEQVVKVFFKVSEDGKAQEGTLNLTTNAYGNCSIDTKPTKI